VIPDREALIEPHGRFFFFGLLPFPPIYAIIKKKTTPERSSPMITVGMNAPDFTLTDKDGHPVSLSDFRGRKVVLYFYPKDNTPGCTRQACAFAGAYQSFRDKNVEVIGISKDSITSHVKFAEKYELPFVLLSDPDLEAIQAYGVWQEKKMCGKVSMGVVRTTFIIGADGMIEKVMNKVKPDTNAAEVLALL
jgi:peroxiredoxin Q/BCP